MKPRSIGIVAGGGGPIGSSSMLREIISECQKKYHSWKSYEYPCMNFYSYPYSEAMLVNEPSSIPSKELSHSIQQLKLLGMEIIVIPCFTMSSYLTDRNDDIEIVEAGAVMQTYLEKNKIKNPLVLCSERTRKSGYCNKHFDCHYPSDQIQKDLSCLIEKALKGEKIDLKPLLQKLPDTPILCAMTTLNAQTGEIDDPRWINPNKLIAEYVVSRSYERTVRDIFSFEKGFKETQCDAVATA